MAISVHGKEGCWNEEHPKFKALIAAGYGDPGMLQRDLDDIESLEPSHGEYAVEFGEENSPIGFCLWRDHRSGLLQCSPSDRNLEDDYPTFGIEACHKTALDQLHAAWEQAIGFDNQEDEEE